MQCFQPLQLKPPHPSEIIQRFRLFQISVVVISLDLHSSELLFSQMCCEVYSEGVSVEFSLVLPRFRNMGFRLHHFLDLLRK